MPGGNIFLNYRRDDTAGHAGRIFDRLNWHFPGRVFRDVTGIAYGADFTEEIERKLGSCQVLIVLIGRHWLTLTDEAGRRRLDDEHDLVRLEIATGLRRNIRVIPVLVGGAHMPFVGELPEDLKPLAHRNALEITEPDFDNDAARLTQAIAEMLGESPGGVGEMGQEARAPHAAKKSRVGLFVGLFVGLGAAALVVFLVAILALFKIYGTKPSPDAPAASNSVPAGQASMTPSQRASAAGGTKPAEADAFLSPVGGWRLKGVGTDFSSHLVLSDDHRYVGEGTFQGVFGKGSGTWEYDSSERVFTFQTSDNAGNEIKARMRIREKSGNTYRAEHSYYGGIIMERDSSR